MATSVSASYSAGDLSSHRSLTRSLQPHQSILPLRRERTSIDADTNRLTNENNSMFSSQLPVRSSALFSGEKQYERRQSSSQARSAKSEEVFRLIDRRLQTGVHGVRLMFRSNDSTQEGKLSKEAFRRVLMQLCGFINAEEWDKVSRMFHLNERDGTITFEEFLSYFPDNDKVKRELALSQIDRRHSSLLNLSHNLTGVSPSHRKRFLPKLTANYCFSLMRARCHDPSFEPSDFLPADCLSNGVIIREHLKTILQKFQLEEILSNENEFEKLWSKFDLENVGMVRSNVFLRHLDYRRNLADEIDANIQRLVSGSSAARFVNQRASSSSSSSNHLNSSSASRRKQRKKLNQTVSPNEDNDDENTSKPKVPPPSAMDYPVHQSISTTETTPTNLHPSTRELSTKFRTLVQQHRQMIKQLNETDEFLPFLDRKINEGYFCLKTVFNYLDPDQRNFITKDQLVAALNQFDVPIDMTNVDGFLRKHRLAPGKMDGTVDYQLFLKYFQDRSDSSFLARTVKTFGKDKSKLNSNSIENAVIDLLHHLFLSFTAAFKHISTEVDDLCPEEELFLILKKELGLNDNYQFSKKQKNEVYHLLNCSEQMKQKRQLPYRRLLHCLSKITLPIPKERMIVEKRDEHPPEKKEEIEDKPLTPPRTLRYIEKTLNDLIRLRMHTFTKCFSRIDQPRTDRINKEQFFDVLQQMGMDLTRSEINLVWSSCGFHSDKSIPFSNLIRQIIMFNREENQLMIQQLQRSQSLQDQSGTSAVRSSLSSSTTTRAVSSSVEAHSNSPPVPSVDHHEIYNRILPYIRPNYKQIKNELLLQDPTACGQVDFSAFLDILHRYSVPISDIEFSSLIRADNPRNGSKVQYPFFIRKYHPDGPMMKSSPWSRVHPVYEQLIQKQHLKHPIKELYDQRMQNPRDLKYLIRLFVSYDKSRKGFLTSDEFYALLCENGITLSKSAEDYYQLFSNYDRQLRDQFNYTDLFRTLIYSIMS